MAPKPLKSTFPDTDDDACIDSGTGGKDARAGITRLFDVGRWSIPARLMAIVLGIAIPLNMVVIAVVWSLAFRSMETQKASLLYSASSVATGVDAHLGKYITVARLLATSPALLDDNFEAFTHEAHRAFAAISHAGLLLADADGQQLLNFSRPTGQPLPRRNEIAMRGQREAFATGNVVISSVFAGRALNGGIVTVEAPVFKNGKPFRLLAIPMMTEGFLQLLNAQEMPTSWLGGIIDREGRFVARVPDHALHVTQSASVGWRGFQHRDGIFEHRSLEGDDVVTANVSSKLGGFAIGIAVRKADLWASILRTVGWALALGASLSALTLLIAIMMARHITRPIAELRDQSQNLLEGRSVTISARSPEIDDLTATLRRAASRHNQILRELRESEERLRMASEAAGFGIHDFDIATSRKFWSPGMHRILGTAPNEPRVAVAEVVHPDDRDSVMSQLRATRYRPGPHEIECRIVRPDGSERWVLDRGEAIGPVDPDTGLVSRITGTLIDITSRKIAEERLDRSVATYYRLIENAPFGVYVVDAEFHLAQASAGAKRVFGSIDPLIGRDFAEIMHILWPAEFATFAIGKFQHTLDTGEPYHSPVMTEPRRDRGKVESYDWQIERVLLPDGRLGVVCYFYDLTEERRAQEQIKLLMREVDHRSKNMLGVVHAIARQTAARNPANFMERFGERIASLASSQDVLVRNAWRGADVSELLMSQLSHLDSLIGSRITLRGPALTITPPAAQGIGMAIHELATNAGKYGALTSDHGRVEIAWAIEDGLFTLEWQELDGPQVVPPDRTGFGHVVLTRMAEASVRGKATVEHAESGLTWRLTCDLDNITYA